MVCIDDGKVGNQVLWRRCGLLQATQFRARIDPVQDGLLRFSLQLIQRLNQFYFCSNPGSHSDNCRNLASVDLAQPPDPLLQREPEPVAKPHCSKPEECRYEDGSRENQAAAFVKDPGGHKPTDDGAEYEPASESRCFLGPINALPGFTHPQPLSCLPGTLHRQCPAWAEPCRRTAPTAGYRRPPRSCPNPIRAAGPLSASAVLSAAGKSRPSFPAPR